MFAQIVQIWKNVVISVRWFSNYLLSHWFQVMSFDLRFLLLPDGRRWFNLGLDLIDYINSDCGMLIRQIKIR